MGQNMYMEGVLETLYLFVNFWNNVGFCVPWVLGTTVLSVKWAICTKVVEVMIFFVLLKIYSQNLTLCHCMRIHCAVNE